MKKLLAMLALIIVVGLATTSCNEDESLENLKIEAESSDEVEGSGDGNDGGSGGNNPPPPPVNG